MNYYTNYLSNNKEIIDKTLVNVLEEWYRSSLGKYSKLDYLKKSFLDAFTGGKRIRGSLVCLGFELFKRSFDNSIIMPAIAYEIFQTAILFQDDVFDKSNLRRGKNTLHIELGGNEHAISKTICLGDIGFLLSHKIICNSNFSDYLKIKAQNVFNNSIINTIIGEILDIDASTLKEPIFENNIIDIAYLKTAYYTTIGPFILGAVLAGATEEYINNLYIFAKNLGIAFQIKDDLMGIYGDEKIIGKSLDSDIKEKKLTILYHYANLNSDKDTNYILNSLYGAKNITIKDIENIQKIFIDTGAKKYAEELMLNYITEAEKSISFLTNDYSMVNILKDLSKYLIFREY